MSMLDTACPVNWNHPLNRNRIGWFLSHDSIPKANTWRNLVGMSGKKPRDGVLQPVGSALPSWKGAAGRPGGFGSIQGIVANSNYVDMTSLDPLLDGLSGATFSGWFNRTSATFCGMNRGVVGNKTRTGFIWFSDNSIYALADTGAANSSPNTGSTATGWHHITCVFDGSQTGTARCALYLDGNALTLVTSGTPPTTITAIGADRGFGAWYASTPSYPTGGVDDLGIWNAPLTAAEVRQLYDQSRQGHPDTLNWLEV